MGYAGLPTPLWNDIVVGAALVAMKRLYLEGALGDGVNGDRARGVG